MLAWAPRKHSLNTSSPGYVGTVSEAAARLSFQNTPPKHVQTPPKRNGPCSDLLKWGQKNSPAMRFSENARSMVEMPKAMGEGVAGVQGAARQAESGPHHWSATLPNCNGRNELPK